MIQPVTSIFRVEGWTAQTVGFMYHSHKFAVSPNRCSVYPVSLTFSCMLYPLRHDVKAAACSKMYTTYLIHQCFPNVLFPDPFRLQKITAILTSHVLCVSRNKQWILSYAAFHDCFFINEMASVNCVVPPGSLNKMAYVLSLKG
jgi:hypothetical protein